MSEWVSGSGSNCVCVHRSYMGICLRRNILIHVNKTHVTIVLNVQTCPSRDPEWQQSSSNGLSTSMLQEIFIPNKCFRFPQYLASLELLPSFLQVAAEEDNVDSGTRETYTPNDENNIVECTGQRLIEEIFISLVARWSIDEANIPTLNTPAISRKQKSSFRSCFAPTPAQHAFRQEKTRSLVIASENRTHIYKGIPTASALLLPGSWPNLGDCTKALRHPIQSANRSLSQRSKRCCPRSPVSTAWGFNWRSHPWWSVTPYCSWWWSLPR